MRKTLTSALLSLSWLTRAATLGLLIALSTLPLGAQDTSGINRPGLILLKTTSATFQVTLRDGMFGPGSDPYVALQLPYLVGQELRTSPAGLFGVSGSDGRPPVDTVLELQYPSARLPGSYEFRVVGLHLKNQPDHPLMVTYNGGASSEPWDVEICLSATKQLVGLIQWTRQLGSNACGGNFTYSLPVTPRLIFTRRGGDHAQKILDPGNTGFITFLASGQWADRDQFSYPGLGTGVTLFGVTNLFQDAYLDANCDGVFDHDAANDCLTEKLPTLRSSDLVLGANCTYVTDGNPPYQWHIQPYTEGVIQTQVVQAATRVSASYPLSATDRLGIRKGRGVAGLAGLAVLGLAAMVIPVRRGREE